MCSDIYLQKLYNTYKNTKLSLYSTAFDFFLKELNIISYPVGLGPIYYIFTYYIVRVYCSFLRSGKKINFLLPINSLSFFIVKLYKCNYLIFSSSKKMYKVDILILHSSCIIFLRFLSWKKYEIYLYLYYKYTINIFIKIKEEEKLECLQWNITIFIHKYMHIMIISLEYIKRGKIYDFDVLWICWRI